MRAHAHLESWRRGLNRATLGLRHVLMMPYFKHTRTQARVYQVVTWKDMRTFRVPNTTVGEGGEGKSGRRERAEATAGRGESWATMEEWALGQRWRRRKLGQPEGGREWTNAERGLRIDHVGLYRVQSGPDAFN